MKKTAFIFTLLLSLTFVQAQSAPLTDVCSPYVTASNYNMCCTGIARTQHSFSCTNYESQHSATPGTIGAGNPDTTPVNSGVVFQAGNPTAVSPQSGSASLAQCSAIQFKSLLDILIWVKCIIVVAIIPLIFAAALMFFLWGVMKFVAASDSAKKEEGKKFIIAGLIGLFVMTSLWGIIRIVSTTLGVNGTVVPTLQTDYLKK